MKNTYNDDEYKDDTSKHQGGHEILDNPETPDTSRNSSVINTAE